jgi:ubiquitin carboxyl-terminal hydrolase 7
MKTVKLTENGSGKIRIFDVTSNGRAQREYTGSEMIGNLAEPAELYAEVSRQSVANRVCADISQEVPLEEMNAGDGTKIVNLFHYSKDPVRTHGVPCKFVLREVSIHLKTADEADSDPQGEPFSETKKRIQERLGVPEKEFARFKFSLVTAHIFKQPSIVEEGVFESYDSFAADR